MVLSPLCFSDIVFSVRDKIESAKVSAHVSWFSINTTAHRMFDFFWYLYIEQNASTKKIVLLNAKTKIFPVKRNEACFSSIIHSILLSFILVVTLHRIGCMKQRTLVC